jgi:BlaI family penicillinase repressor
MRNVSHFLLVKVRSVSQNPAMADENASAPPPSEGEQAILQVLWQQGPCTVRQVHEALDRDVGYTTVMKLMQIMAGKGLVERDEASRAHLYRAAVRQESVEKGIVRRLLRTAFAGSAARLAVRALSTRKPSQAELSELRQLIENLQKGDKS